jgi:two-component system, NarL family, invasion response regulator UvrY
MPSPIKIAIADDSELIRNGLKVVLENFKFVVAIEAKNGNDLLLQIDKVCEIPHVCILDYNMPEMNGLQTMVALKSKFPSIKIVGHSLESINGKIMLSKGADAFILKGCGTDEIYKTITDLFVK